MPVNDELGKRIKENYENRYRFYLTRRTPVMLRIDGAHFHTFTKGFEKPFDKILVRAMQETMRYLCEKIQGCVFGYTQSDEITLVLVDYQTLESEAWFDYNLQKICSTAAAMSTMYFNKFFNKEVRELVEDADDLTVAFHASAYDADYMKLIDTYEKAIEKGATFDCRAFNIPKEEVVNAVYWRQIDAMRNSIQMIGQANYSQKQLQNKSCARIKEMLKSEKNINWEDYPSYLRWGTCCIKTDGEWFLHLDMPLLKGDDRQLLENLINVGD